MKKTQMNLKRGSFAYGDNLSQAPQLKKEDLHSRISVAINEYLNTKRLCRPTTTEPDDVPLILPQPQGSCSSSSLLNKKRIPIASLDPRLCRPTTNEPDDVPLIPRFEGSCSSSSSLNKKRIPIASLDPGYIPPKFSLNPNWLVAAGEDSQECLSQRNRESKVQEAIYRHRSSIPPNPIVSLEVQREDYDDSLTPIIPIIPIEELEMAHSSPHILEKPQLPVNTSSSSIMQQQQQQQQKKPIHSSANKFPNTPCCVNKAAADKNMSRPSGGTDAIVSAAALALLLKSDELTSMIDTDLLLKILSDPKMIGALLCASNSASPPKSCATGAAAAAADEPPPQKKEEDYYKKLIRQHGGENIMTEMITSTSSSHLNSNNNNNNKAQKVNIKEDKSKKLCRFFNSKSGCRNGVSCLFLHEAKQPFPSNAAAMVVEERSAKRLRVS